ncbi:phytase [Pseudoalteromonas sp. SCSIO 43201]|uniref:phytase n=1 Tax=Pseudoalteromonas sp. SCSIO 43201 TaxID=2822842 RepID=UPI002076486B|nr:phytase [Pseudoalteromonas sp. SCSIO 43201]USD27256.1 phytase [Pseudoalteromonas sp. SCSIO 43201]
MKCLSFPLSWFLCSLFTYGHTTNAYASDEPWLTHAEFIYPVNTLGVDERPYLAVSSTQGVALLDTQGKVLSSIDIKSEHLDFRWLPESSQVGILSTLDINSGKAQLIKVDVAAGELRAMAEFSAKNTAIDALCVGSSSEHVELYTVDVDGSVQQLAINTKNIEHWYLHPVRDFTVGPNIKSCTVDDTAQTLYIAEENIGIWRYSANPEHEVNRTLLQLPTELEVEYVDATSFGDVAVVSPDSNHIWLFDSTNNTFNPIALTHDVAPKTLQLQREGTSLVAYLFDEKSGHSRNIELSNIPTKQGDITQGEAQQSFTPYGQTQPVQSYGDAADDPAIWVNSKVPSQSLVYGTDKKSGLNVYDLEGKLLKSLPVGRVNNVDIRYNINVNGETVDIAAASNRTSQSISLFKIDRGTGLPSLLGDLKTDLADPYGLCMGKYGKDLAVWVNDTDGRFQKYNIEFNNNMATATMTMQWTVPSQPEGCVSDDENLRLFYGEESTGVWLKNLDEKSADTLIATTSSDVHADIEGMSLFTVNDQHYLIVSSQGNNRYAVYAVDDNNKYLGVFAVGANWTKMIDGASETDGLDVTSHHLGQALPDGLLVVQDGHNVMPKAAQNFKLVSGTLLRNWILEKIN